MYTDKEAKQVNRHLNTMASLSVRSDSVTPGFT
jgi:hypothetical protein